MRTFLIISDSHGHKRNIEALEPLIAENEFVDQIGDGNTDMREITSRYPEKVYVMQGNCDFYPALSEYVLETEGVRIFMCHGHRYRVKYDLTRLAEEAKAHDCTVALYGHTHTPLITEIDGVTLINPGSLRFPVGQGGSYCYMTVHKGKVCPVIVGESIG